MNPLDALFEALYLVLDGNRVMPLSYPRKRWNKRPPSTAAEWAEWHEFWELEESPRRVLIAAEVVVLEGSVALWGMFNLRKPTLLRTCLRAARNLQVYRACANVTLYPCTEGKVLGNGDPQEDEYITYKVPWWRRILYSALHVCAAVLLHEAARRETARLEAPAFAAAAQAEAACTRSLLDSLHANPAGAGAAADARRLEALCALEACLEQAVALQPGKAKRLAGGSARTAAVEPLAQAKILG